MTPMKYPALLLVTAIAAHAVEYTAPTILQPGYSVNEGVVARGPLALAAGTYTASSWLIADVLTLSTPGEYIIAGTASVVGPVAGPPTGTATIRFTTPLVMPGAVASNVTVLQGPAPAPRESPPLVNISTRATLSAGQTLTSGFVVGGTVRRRVLVRAIGPSLTSFGVTNPLPTPTLTVFSGATQIAANAGWGGGAPLSTVFAAAGAFFLPQASRDAAAVLTLNPGSYTAQVGGGAGEEVYFVD